MMAVLADDFDRVVREPECKRITGLSRTTRWRMIRKGDFPRPLQLSENAKGWRASWIRDWLAAREQVAA
jgi:prophage regulatory protein